MFFSRQAGSGVVSRCIDRLASSEANLLDARKTSESRECEPASPPDPVGLPPNSLITSRESLHGGVPISADRDPLNLMFSPAISARCGSFGWGSASVLIHKMALAAARWPEEQQIGAVVGTITWALLTTGTGSKSKVSRVLPGRSRASARWPSSRRPVQGSI
jgi:hypothetical protein